MIGLEAHMLLRHYLAEGLSKADIARRLGINVRTIRRWIAAGELDRDLDEPPRYTPRPPRPTKLDPYHEIVRTRLADYPELSAVRLFEEVRAAGYAGSYAQVRDFVRRVRPRPAPEPVVRFETPPGHQAQVDFAEFHFPWGKRYAFVAVLGYSRLLFLRFSARQDMRALFDGLEAAFEAFGGVPQEVLFDQMKSVITADLRLLGGQLVVNEEFSGLQPTGAFGREPAVRTGRRPRARSSGRSATSGTTSSTAGTSSATTTSQASSRAGWSGPTTASTAPRARSRASALSAPRAASCSRWQRARTARWCFGRTPSAERSPRLRSPGLL